jgi:DNA polymerase
MTDDGPMIVHNCGFGLGANGFEQNVWDMERVRLTPEESQTIVQAYRDASPQIVTFWYGIDTAFRKLVNDPKAAAEVGRLRLHREGECICIRLPSGRQLRYWQPSLETTQEGKQELRFSAATDHRNKLWRGLLVENIVQATARDVLTDRMLELDRQGLSIVGHVHDEVLIEMDETLDTANVHQIMSTNPGWADSLPLAAETAKGRRYTK